MSREIQIKHILLEFNIDLNDYVIITNGINFYRAFKDWDSAIKWVFCKELENYDIMDFEGVFDCILNWINFETIKKDIKELYYVYDNRNSNIETIVIKGKGD